MPFTKRQGKAKGDGGFLHRPLVALLPALNHINHLLWQLLALPVATILVTTDGANFKCVLFIRLFFKITLMLTTCVEVVQVPTLPNIVHFSHLFRMEMPCQFINALTAKIPAGRVSRIMAVATH